MSDRPACEVTVTVVAPPGAVWELVSDVTRVGEWGAECVGAHWIDGPSGPVVGARFRGRQVRQDREWETTSVVIDAEPGRSFAWVVGEPDNASATWRYRLIPEGAGTHVTYRAELGPGSSGLTAAIARTPEREEQIIAGRLAEHRRNMTATLAAIKALAEAG